MKRIFNVDFAKEVLNKSSKAKTSYAEMIRKHFNVETYQKGKKLVIVGDVSTNDFLSFISTLTVRLQTEASIEVNNVTYLFNKNGEYKVFSF